MSDEYFFDQFVTINGYGSRLSAYNQLYIQEAELVGFLHRIRAAVNSATAQLPRLEAVYSDYVRSDKFGARAFKYQSRYFIAVHDGLALIVKWVLRRMLSDSRTFSVVGNQATESPDLPAFPAVILEVMGFEHLLPQIPIPTDPYRASFAELISYLIFDFLGSHELTHIAHGHVDYLSSQFGVLCFSEMELSAGMEKIARSKPGNLEIQAMEMAADLYASYVWTKAAISMTRPWNDSKSRMLFFFRDPASTMYTLGVAVSVFLRLCGDRQFTSPEPNVTHPPPRLRQMIVLKSMAWFASGHWGIEYLEQIQNSVSKALEDVEAAYEVVTGTDQAIAGLHSAFGEAGDKYAQTLEDCWRNSLRDRLQAYAFQELPESIYS